MVITNSYKDILNLFINSFSKYGLKRSTAEILATLLLEPEPLCMDGIAERTRYSISMISNTIKIIERFGVLDQKRIPGDKKTYYLMEKDLFKFIQTMMKFKLNNEVNPITRELPDLISTYKEESKKLSKEQKEQAKKRINQLNETLGYYTNLGQFMKLLTLMKQEDVKKIISMHEKYLK